ncbi:MAG: hypothetical protein EOP04_31655 [Proteobacteria bacterium]|nr:MAG: hypothetical protein EOP04_31655 [Pseudomonadota bacterium]
MDFFLGTLFEWLFVYLGASVRMVCKYGLSNWRADKFKETVRDGWYFNLMISVIIFIIIYWISTKI